YEKDCFKKFFLNLRDIDLIIKYTEICSSTEKNASLEATDNDKSFSTKLKHISKNLDNKEKYKGKDSEYFSGLFICEAIMARICSRKIYKAIHLQNSFYTYVRKRNLKELPMDKISGAQQNFKSKT
ncbi:hypothetical protein CWI38_0547p0010, partial [Hamiltosporidium tvaerminnensis]